MWKIPIIEQTPGLCEQKDPLHDLRSLPDFYMADYSVQGILVDRLDVATGILEASGYTVETLNTKRAAEVTVDVSGRLWHILELLRGQRVCCSVGDIIDEIYRG
jgi:hypothetical protein